MEVLVFHSGGLLGELLLTQGDLEVRRVGKARYLARFVDVQIAAFAAQPSRRLTKGTSVSATRGSRRGSASSSILHSP
jgi:hypothetical protein